MTDLRRFRCAKCGSLIIETVKPVQGETLTLSWLDYVEIPYCDMCEPDKEDPVEMLLGDAPTMFMHFPKGAIIQ